MSTQTVPGIATFADTVAGLVAEGLDERTLTARIRDELEAALAAGLELPEEVTRPDPVRYVMYPLHVAADGGFSIASAVWDVGQGTPVHGHETWGVVGIHSGVEVETRYEKPAEPDVPLVREGTDEWTAGQVTVCCTTDDDVHQVRCGGDRPVVGIHVYGADIGTLPRRGYDPDTGAVHWFTSRWADHHDTGA
ncbi:MULTISPECIES: cysteine dioxygenase family protein [Nocardioides]|uniref:Predicted metal-dependent enzyme of the double-stranded beta helix superfamily n=1 Tax=Nocardioides lianchengensis TaxID=1045774 RepID=A0A1G6ZYM8_9ACTN|nr:cysteine dioxygenase family protein [Nocardioides lianchengensis]NYG12275.1 putative metal-dependent enzyme (double-stranded beta helix superfamily) [Nocardioides lianchengensis]SDE07357.1 Predicted metal-dependent enzyme of the double-stranded beta helix superfamily [Nocardioides lianchengensis]